MIYSSEEGVTIEESALHESEPVEDSPLMRKEDSDSLSKESQQVEYTKVSIDISKLVASIDNKVESDGD